VADAPLARHTRIRVRYADTDRMGIAYHANYFVWFEVGRTEWLRESGWTYREIEEGGVSLPVIEAHCEYSLPARYDDEIEISTAATVLSQVRLRFDYEARLTGSSALAATGHTVHASLGTNGRPRRLPPRVLELLPRSPRHGRDSGTMAVPSRPGRKAPTDGATSIGRDVPLKWLRRPANGSRRGA
jgi:acyl-CoA thioester hydrolase